MGGTQRGDLLGCDGLGVVGDDAAQEGGDIGDIPIAQDRPEGRHRICILEPVCRQNRRGTTKNHIDELGWIAGDDFVADERGLHVGHAAAIRHMADGARLRIKFGAA